MLSQAPAILSTCIYMSLYILLGKNLVLRLKNRYSKQHSMMLVEKGCSWNQLKSLK